MEGARGSKGSGRDFRIEAKGPCICFLFPLAPFCLSEHPFGGKLLQHFCLKGKMCKNTREKREEEVKCGRERERKKERKKKEL